MKKNRPNSTSGTEIAVEVLKELLELSPEELLKRINENIDNKPHWAVKALEDAGYFDNLNKNKDKK